MDKEGQELRVRFLREAEDKGNRAQMLIAAIKLPTGAVEIITNTAQIPTKVDYYKTAYNEEFKLKANTNVSIIGYMFI